MAKSLEHPLINEKTLAIAYCFDSKDSRYFSRKIVMAQFAHETCVPMIGGNILLGSTRYDAAHDKSLYNDYLEWCVNAGYHPEPLVTFFADFLLSVNRYLKWKNAHIERTIDHDMNYREDRVFGISYKESGAANHG